MKQATITTVDAVAAVLACEIEAGVFEQHVMPALEVARKVAAEQAQQAEPVARDALAEGFYWLSKKDGTEQCLVRVYKCEGFLGVGFGVWDGGAYMPLSDVTEDSVFVPLYAQPPAVAAQQEETPPC